MPPLILTVLGWWVLWRQGFFLVDDAYIGFRYALNLAHGHGLVWNPGEPVEGYTNLLWVLLLSPFAALGLDLVVPAAVLGTLAGCGAIEVLRRVSWRALGPRRPLLHGFAGLLLATNPTFVYWAVSGMETPLFAFLVLLSAHLLSLQEHRPSVAPMLSVTLVAAYFTRPEGLLVTGVLFAVEWMRPSGSTAAFSLARLRPLAVPAGVLATTVAIHVSLRLAYYGYLLPNTFYAKVILNQMTLARGLAHLSGFLVRGGVLVLPGLFALWRARASLRAVLWQGYALLFTYGAYLLLIGGDFPEWYRFYAPLLPIPFVALAELVCRLGDPVAHRFAAVRRLAVFRGGPLFTGLALLAVVAPNFCFWRRAEPASAPGLRLAHLANMAVVRSFLDPQVPRDSTIAMSAVGIMSYYRPQNRVIDCWGLNDTHIAHRPPRASPRSRFAHDKEDWLYVLNQLPDYIITFRTGPPSTVKGYDICWPSHVVPLLLVLRRNFALSDDQRAVGVPRGHRRTLVFPPSCALPPPGK
jgi:hypothetical protein